MADSYYPQDDGADDAAAPQQSDDTPPTETNKDEQEPEGETALLPKSILAGKEFKPGEEVVLKIVHLYDDEVEVEYAKDEADSNSNEKEDSPEMAGAMGKLSAMGGGGGGGY